MPVGVQIYVFLLCMGILGVVAALSGVALLVLGVRGRRVDDHPLCRTCGFDLFGVRVGESGRPARCTECGVGLESPRTIRVGNRERRAGWLRWGLALALLGVVLAGAIGGVLLAGPRVQKRLPNSLLFAQLRFRTDARSNDPLEELLDRSERGGLSHEEDQRLVKLAAREIVKISPSTSLNPRWNWVLEVPRLFDLLGAEERRRVLSAGIEPFVRSRTRVRSNLPIHLGFRTMYWALFRNARWLECRDPRVVIRDSAGRVVLDRVIHAFASGPVEDFAGERWNTIEAPIDVPPGHYSVTISGEWNERSTAPNATPDPKFQGTAVVFSASSALEVVEQNASLVEVVNDEQLHDAFQTWHFVYLSKSPYSATETWVSMGIGALSARNDMREAAFEDGRLWGVYRVEARANVAGTCAPLLDLGHCIVGRKQGVWNFTPGGQNVKGDVPAGLYTVRLIPDVEHAERQIGIDRVLGGEIVFEDLRLRP